MESETVAALRRAGKRVVFHLMRAGLEGLKAIEAVVDELARVNRTDNESADKPTHIEVE
ncbi:MAG TPA: hypothetical protein VIA81_04560 [Acidimicrobiia bacterium]